MEKEPIAALENLELTPEQELIVREFRGKISELLPEYSDTINKKLRELQGQYPDYKQYYLYEQAFRSTPLGCTKFDFPGNDSIEKFINELYRDRPADQKNVVDESLMDFRSQPKQPQLSPKLQAMKEQIERARREREQNQSK